MRNWSRLVTLSTAAAVLLFDSAATDARPLTSSTGGVTQQIDSMPLTFTENKGQWDEQVLFRASAGGTTLWLGRNGIIYQFTHRIPRTQAVGTAPLAAEIIPHQPVDRAEPDSIETAIVQADFVGSAPTVEIKGEEPLDYRCNYFLGNDPSKWRTDVSNYAAVVYRDVYPGVDVRYEGKAGVLTCSYEAKSKSDLAQVKLRYSGFDSDHPRGNAVVTETGLGQFHMETPWGAMFEPLSSVRADALDGDVAASTPDASGAALVSLAYSTFLGGSIYENRGEGIAVDKAGSAYVAGYTYASNFPTLNPYDGSLNGAYDIFVTKLAPTGNALVYSTFLGGGGQDEAYRIAVDAFGSAYVTGYTTSSNFPTQNPYDGTYNDGRYDAFVSKLSPAGNALMYSTYLGGSGDDEGYGIAVDALGSAYVAGRTSSTNFPTQNPYDSSFGGKYDVFVTKLSPAGNTLVYSTYLGGDNYEFGYGIAVDPSGSAYVTGRTVSNDFPTKHAYDSTYNNIWDVFVTKLSPAGNTLEYSTYLGGSSDDEAYGIAVDKVGSAYVVGFTKSSDFPTQHPYDSSYNGDWDVFVTKLSPAGNALIYSTYLGGGKADFAFDIAVNAVGSASVTGYTLSSDFPTLNAYDGSFGSASDAFVAQLSASGNSLVYSTFLGGSSDDHGYGIAVDAIGGAYVTGYTLSSDFPTHNAYDGSYNTGLDVFVTKLSIEVLTGIVDDNGPSGIPEHFTLLQNYPNPFNAGTAIRYTLPKNGPVKLEVFDILGRQVRTLLDEIEPAGAHIVTWDGTDRDGQTLASGVYFYRLTTGNLIGSKKMILLK